MAVNTSPAVMQHMYISFCHVLSPARLKMAVELIKEQFEAHQDACITTDRHTITDQTVITCLFKDSVEGIDLTHRIINKLKQNTWWSDVHGTLSEYQQCRNYLLM